MFSRHAVPANFTPRPYKVSGRPYVFYVGDLGSAVEHARMLSRRLGEVDDDPFLLRQPLTDWRSLIEYIGQRNRPFDLVLDEFPYLCEAEPALPSYVQNAWDTNWKDKPVRIVLCGSSVGFMEREILGERSPLFGRRTGQMRLEAMDFWSARGFMTGFDAATQIEAFACFGGMPAYLSKIDPTRRLDLNVEDQILDPVSYLHDEPRLMLAQELREPRNYFAILTSIAAGHTRLNDIVQDCGLERHVVSRYLDTLIGLELVDREVPVTEPDPARSRRGLYRLRDPFFRYWFRFVHPNLSDLHLLDPVAVWKRSIEPEMSHFVAPVFERLCAEWVHRRGASGDLGFRPDRCGRWWEGDMDMDVLAYDRNNVLFGECTWSTRAVGPAVLDDLRARAAKVRGFADHKHSFALFSRSGFRRGTPTDDVLHVDLSALVEDRMP